MAIGLSSSGSSKCPPNHTRKPLSTPLTLSDSLLKGFKPVAALEHPQSLILTDSIYPILQRLHPDNKYAIGQDCGIYWRKVDPPELGAVAPDWFYVPNVPPSLDSKTRRSYVMWHEYLAPLIVLEFANGDGSEERDTTPLLRTTNGTATTKPGKLWVYEQVIHVPYYGIFVIDKAELEVYHLRDSSYHKMPTNAQGRYPIEPLGVELGLWHGTYLGQKHQWLRWWDSEGNLLLLGHERANRAEQAQHDAIPCLHGMGLSVEQIAKALGLNVEEVKQQL